jgi:hypothetical protein
MSIFSYGNFLVKLDRKDKGKTKAALPTRTNPKSIELTITDVPGLRIKRVNHYIQKIVKIILFQLVFYDLGMYLCGN